VVLQGVWLLKKLQGCRVIKDPVAFYMHGAATSTTGHHLGLEENLQLLGVGVGFLGPGLLTDAAVLLLLALLIAVGAQFEVLGPLILPVLASLPAAALLTLYATLAVEVQLAGCCDCSCILRVWIRYAAGHGQFHRGVHALIVIGGVAALADEELLHLAFAAGAQAVHTPDAVRAPPLELSGPQMQVVQALLV
jgi:hypothetical protein